VQGRVYCKCPRQGAQRGHGGQHVPAEKPPNSDGFLMKVDKNGRVLWTKCYGGKRRGFLCCYL